MKHLPHAHARYYEKTLDALSDFSYNSLYNESTLSRLLFGVQIQHRDITLGELMHYELDRYAEESEKQEDQSNDTYSLPPEIDEDAYSDTDPDSIALYTPISDSPYYKKSTF